MRAAPAVLARDPGHHREAEPAASRALRGERDERLFAQLGGEGAAGVGDQAAPSRRAPRGRSPPRRHRRPLRRRRPPGGRGSSPRCARGPDPASRGHPLGQLAGESRRCARPIRLSTPAMASSMGVRGSPGTSESDGGRANSSTSLSKQLDVEHLAQARWRCAADRWAAACHGAPASAARSSPR